jgi:hypothetical protein
MNCTKRLRRAIDRDRARSGVFAETVMYRPCATSNFSSKEDLRHEDAPRRGPEKWDARSGKTTNPSPLGWVVFGVWLQPTCDPIIAALDERPDHLFQRVLHVGGIANSTAVFNPLHQDGTARFDLLMTSGRLEPFGTLVTPTPPTMLTRTNRGPVEQGE